MGCAFLQRTVEEDASHEFVVLDSDLTIDLDGSVKLL